MMKRLYNWLFPMCPSLLGHRVRIGVVTDSEGSKWCWHRDCLRASRARVNKAKEADQKKLAEFIGKAVAEAIAREKSRGLI